MERLDGGVLRARAHAVAEVGDDDDQRHGKDRNQGDDDRLDLVAVVLEGPTCRKEKENPSAKPYAGVLVAQSVLP